MSVRILKDWDEQSKHNFCLCVHDGIFHADDVLCVALADIMLMDNIDVVRTRDMNIIRKADACMDIKTEYGNFDVSDKNGGPGGVFDHHTKEVDAEGNDIRKRYPSNVEGLPGILYCAASQFFDWITENAMDPDKKEIIDNRLLKPVACQDNGQELSDYGMKVNPLSFVSYMNPIDNRDADARFLECVEMARSIYRSIAEKADKTLADNREISVRLLRTVSNQLGYFEMDAYLDDWIPRIVAHNDGEPKITCAIFKGKVRGWNLQMVPKEVGNFETWHKIPDFITEGSDGCTFVHADRWLAAFNTKEEALEAARKTAAYFS